MKAKVSLTGSSDWENQDADFMQIELHDSLGSPNFIPLPKNVKLIMASSSIVFFLRVPKIAKEVQTEVLTHADSLTTSGS